MSRSVSLSVAVLVGLLFVGSASAKPEDRVLGEHAFVFPATFQSAFVTTHFGFQQGLAALSAPNVPLGEGNDFDLSAMGVTEDVDVGIALTDSLGLLLQGAGYAIVGANGDSALLLGGLGNFTAVGGPIWSLYRGKSTLLSVYGQGTWGKQMQVSPLGYVNAALASGAMGDSDDLLNQQKSLGFQAGVAAAQGFGDAFGLQAGLQYSAASTNAEGDTDTDKWLWLSGAASLDLRAAAGIPTAFALEYSHQMDQVDDMTQKLIGAAAYFSGRDDLQLGFFLGTMLFEKTEQFPDGQSFLYGKFTMRYFF